jgi:hypothetical protein
MKSLVIPSSYAYDVLKKLADETKANIYFNTDTKGVVHSYAIFPALSGEGFTRCRLTEKHFGI